MEASGRARVKSHARLPAPSRHASGQGEGCVAFSVDSRVLRFEGRQCTARLPEIIGLMAGSGDLPGGCVRTVSG